WTGLSTHSATRNDVPPIPRIINKPEEPFSSPTFWPRLLIPPEFPGIPLHSFLWDFKGTESGFSFPGTQKGTRRKIPLVIKSYKIVNRVATRPPGWCTKQSNTPSADGSRIRKELKPADGAGEYV
ncbi:hypothetical protein THAOC_29563, partial [Thalassiosira oceanica]